MKLTKEQIEKLNRLPSAAENNFSKLANFKAPDSPPPEVNEKEEEGGNKFNDLMKVACSIKSHQLESQRKKFELLPSYLKAGVYYTQKHEVIKKQENMQLKYLSYQLLTFDGNQEFLQGRFDRACRKYEEALAVFRYIESTDPNWQEKGIDDDKIKEVEIKGSTQKDQQKIRELKINTYLNIAACNIKNKAFEAAVNASNEVLQLDPKNLKALYRRARATALPINAGVPEFQKALKDIDQILNLQKKNKKAKQGFIIKEKERIQHLIDINSQRERDTYAKMFSPNKSITEIVQQKLLKNPLPGVYKTQEDIEFDKDIQSIYDEVDVMIKNKINDFSFEIKPGWETAPYPSEVDDLQNIIDKTVDAYRILKKTRKYKDAKMVKEKIRDTIYAKQHLKLVMNMDFYKPTEKMRKLADQSGVDLSSDSAIAEFKKIQNQNLKDIQLMKEGKSPPSHDEFQEQLRIEREQEFEKRIEEQKQKELKNKQQIEKFIEMRQKLDSIKEKNNIFSSSTDNSNTINQNNELFNKDMMLIVFLGIVWVILIIFSNYDNQDFASSNNKIKNFNDSTLPYNQTKVQGNYNNSDL